MSQFRVSDTDSNVGTRYRLTRDHDSRITKRQRLTEPCAGCNRQIPVSHELCDNCISYLKIGGAL